MSAHNICFYGEVGKIIPKLTPNTAYIGLFGDDAISISLMVKPSAIILPGCFQCFVNKVKLGVEKR